MAHAQRTKGLVLFAVMLGTSLTVRALAQAPPTPQERVAALKQSLAESQKAIRRYEWIETTVISLKGEEKARTQKRVYYGADGTLQKLPMGDAAPPAPAPASGRRGGRLKEKIVENKKDDMKEYMERAAALIERYIPPKAEDIQRAKDGVKLTAGPAGQARLAFTDFLLPGDRLALDVDAAANRLVGLTVESYLDKREDAVTLAVQADLFTSDDDLAIDATFATATLRC